MLRALVGQLRGEGVGVGVGRRCVMALSRQTVDKDSLISVLRGAQTALREARM